MKKKKPSMMAEQNQKEYILKQLKYIVEQIVN